MSGIRNISDLPEDIRILAEYNRIQFTLDSHPNIEEDAIIDAFDWTNSPEGFNFWYHIFYRGRILETRNKRELQTDDQIIF